MLRKRQKVDIEVLANPLELIKQYHAKVQRKTRKPFYLHPVAVAHIVLEYSQEQDTILAALLHNTVEDTRLSLTQVGLPFNPAVQQLVAGVTHLDSHLKSSKRVQLSAYENIQQLLEMKDEQILYVKLADRLHNMRTIGSHASLAKQEQIAEETFRFFVPVAKRLKLHLLAEELKQLAAAVLKKIG